MARGDIIPIWEIPYLDKAQIGPDRFLASLVFHDDEWHTWVQTQDNKFIEIHGWPAESFYFARKPEQPADLSLAFLDFMAHQASFIEMKLPFSAIKDDILNLSASFAKLKLIHSQQELERTGGHRMAATEVEYILMLCRGLFDFLQEIILKLWERMALTDQTIKKKQLKKSFADMALSANVPRSAESIMKRFALPDFLAQCYVQHTPVFVKIKEFRDNLVHRGQHVQTIFYGKDGFVIQRRLGPFLNPDIWRDGEAIENDLVPLMPALALVIHGTLAACEEFAYTFASRFKLLEPMVPGMHLFLRGYFNEPFREALRDADERVREGRGLLPAAPSAEGDVENSGKP
jgi:hypothetical protein